MLRRTSIVFMVIGLANALPLKSQTQQPLPDPSNQELGIVRAAHSHSFESGIRVRRSADDKSELKLGATSIAKVPIRLTNGRHEPIDSQGFFTDYNTSKRVRKEARPAIDLEECALEGGQCTCDGTVYYGARESWTSMSNTGVLPCSNAQFGDPIPGVFKTCLCDTSEELQVLLGAAGGIQFDATFIGFESNNNARVAVEHSLELWSNLLLGPGVVKIEITFGSLQHGILGGATPVLVRNFPSSPNPAVYYPAPLMEHLCQVQCNDTSQDCASDCPQMAYHMYLTLNKDYTSWYFGTDGNIQAELQDLVTTTMHEICHGLGIVSTYTSLDHISSEASLASPVATAFDTLLVDGITGQRVVDIESTLLLNALKSENLWARTNENAFIKIYAPQDFDPTSSISHFDSIYSDGPNDLMMPWRYRNTATHEPGVLALCLLHSLGWNVAMECTSSISTNAGTPIPAVAMLPEYSFEPRGASLCAMEFENCVCTGIVRYGANGRFNFKASDSGLNCTNDVFGDPIPGHFKTCLCSPHAEITSAAPKVTTTYRTIGNLEESTSLESSFEADSSSLCAMESEVCSCSGIVRYGSNGFFRYIISSSDIDCTNEVFGDPIPGSLKFCMCLSFTVTSTATSPSQHSPNPALSATTMTPTRQPSTAFPSYMPTSSPSFTSTVSPQTLIRLGNGCCRTEDGGEGDHHVHVGIDDLDACTTLCDRSAGCTGIEYIADWGLCEVHHRTISFATDYASCVCMAWSNGTLPASPSFSSPTGSPGVAPSASPPRPTIATLSIAPSLVPTMFPSLIPSTSSTTLSNANDRCSLPAPFAFRRKRNGVIHTSACSASKLNGLCYRRVRLTQAESICENIGARLCTQWELEDDVAISSGCGNDMRMTWSSSNCHGGSFLVPGSTRFDAPVLCGQRQSDLGAVRCCA